MRHHFFSLREFKARGKVERGRVYLFFGFGAQLVFYLPAIARYRKHGFSVITFRFRTRAILGLTSQNLPQAIDQVCDAVQFYERNQPHQGYAVALGSSMGSVFALHVASRVASIDKVIANTGYALISKHIFEDKIGEHWRKKLLADGIDQQAFHAQIRDCEPLSVLPKLAGKKILICLDRDDNVISFSNSILYKKVLDEHDITYEYIENHHMRHGTAIFKNLQSKRMLEFLKA